VLAKDLVGVASIRHLVVQHAQGHTSPPPPVSLDGHPQLAAMTVRPHDLGDYDRLGEDEHRDVHEQCGPLGHAPAHARRAEAAALAREGDPQLVAAAVAGCTQVRA